MSSSERLEVGKNARHEYDYGSIASLINNEVSYYYVTCGSWTLVFFGEADHHQVPEAFDRNCK